MLILILNRLYVKCKCIHQHARYTPARCSIYIVDRNVAGGSKHYVGDWRPTSPRLHVTWRVGALELPLQITFTFKHLAHLQTRFMPLQFSFTILDNKIYSRYSIACIRSSQIQDLSSNMLHYRRSVETNVHPTKLYLTPIYINVERMWR